MKTQFINDFKAGADLLDEPLLLKDMVRRVTKDDRPYILCTFGDRSGQIGGVYWDVPESVDKFMRPGLVLFVSGKINRYKDSLQVAVSDLYPQENPDLSDFMPSSSRSTEEMIEDLKGKIGRLGDPWNRLLTALLLEDEFLSRYANAPAAKMMHHASVGGLLEHSLSMASLGEMLADHYPHVDKDLLIAGALVHDMGKVWEYSFDGVFDVSEDGHLIGHITRAVLEVERIAVQLGDIPAEALQTLQHLILSHHGTLEFGSPVKPKTLEAILLHQIDLMDSRVQGFFDYLNGDTTDTGWSAKQSPMHSTVLKRPDSFN